MATEDDSSPAIKEPRFVDKALRAPALCPKDPQAYLHGSNHPYAPFPGNAITWESYVYDDGTTYEGLCREEVPHGKGTLVMGNGSGGGFQRVKKGDTYEGEFQGGFAHGLGQYTSYENSEIFRGEYYAGKRQGCGMSLDVKPFIEMVNEGVDPTEAWRRTERAIYSKAKFGTWRKDFFVAEPDERGQKYCHINEIKGTLEEIDSLLTKVRMFKWKPDGEVTYMTAQDDHGIPLNLLQDPLHYPYGTKFMAPGPLGQCYEVPEDEELRENMMIHADNYQCIHDMYNLEYDPEPGSDLFNALKLHDKKLKEQEAIAKEKAESTMSERMKRKKGPAQKKPKDKSETPTASVTMNFARGLGNLIDNFGSGLSLGCTRARLTRPSQRR